MGMVDQVLRTVDIAPLSGKLREIELILSRVGADGGLSEDEALEAISSVVGKTRPSGPTYQKALG